MTTHCTMLICDGDARMPLHTCHDGLVSEIFDDFLRFGQTVARMSCNTFKMRMVLSDYERVNRDFDRFVMSVASYYRFDMMTMLSILIGSKYDYWYPINEKMLFGDEIDNPSFTVTIIQNIRDYGDDGDWMFKGEMPDGTISVEVKMHFPMYAIPNAKKNVAQANKELGREVYAFNGRKKTLTFKPHEVLAAFIMTKIEIEKAVGDK